MKAIHILATLSALFVAGHSYTIDDDCGDDRDWVRDHANAAFGLAATAADELRKNPINADIDHVFELLFGRRPGDRIAALQLVETKLEALAAISTLDGPVGEGVTDVRLYCTTKRITKNKEGRYVNKDEDYIYPLGEITSRWASCYDLLPPTLMITTNPDGQHSEIQICPWFLRKARGFKYTDFKSFNAVSYGGLAKLLMDTIADRVYTQIDAFQLFDKVLLHEMTHLAQSGRTVDMSDPGKPYGWNNCRDLANIYNANDQQAPFDPQNNADSIALMASAIQLITTGTTVNDDGSLVHPAPHTKRRDVPMYAVSWIA